MISKYDVYNLAPAGWEWSTNIHSDVLTEEIFIDSLSNSYGQLAFFPPYIKRNSRNLALYLDGDVYIDREQFQVYKDAYQSHPTKFHRHLLKLHRTYFSEFLTLSKKISQQESKFSEMPKTTIYRLFADFMRSFYKVGVIIDIPFMADYALTSLLRELLLLKGVAVDKVENLIFNLSVPSKLSNAAKEKEELRSIITLIKRKRLVSLFLHSDILQLEQRLEREYPLIFNLLQKHVKKYAYLHLVFFSVKPWSLSILLQRIKDELLSTETKINTNKKSTYKKVLSNQSVRRLAYYLRSISFIRTWRLETANRGIYLALPLLEEISKRLHLSYKELEYLTKEEISSCLKSGKIVEKEQRRKIKIRQKGFSVVIDTKYKPLVVAGRYSKEFKSFFSEKYAKGEEGITKGVCAYPGKVRGKVKIILSPQQKNDFKRGDILVTAMTTTDFVPLMEKAGAIVTDIGGTTAHAAILARELKKPCIIGTRIATKVLRDGDLVEVDADKGVVVKLNKSK